MIKETSNKIITTLVFIFFMLIEFKSFAQLVPGDEDEDGGLEGGDGIAPAPINSSKILILLILGIVFAYFHFKKITAVKKADA